MTVSEKLARETQELTFEQLPAEVVHEVKRRVIDTLACAVGGYDSPPSKVIRDLIKDLGGPAESTVVGNGLRTSAMNAALANGVMVRYTEAMDRSLESKDGLVQHGHPGEVIPGVLAVGERQHSNGKEIVTAVVLGYQLMNRLSYAMGGATPISRLGWKHEIRAGLIVPLVVGKLMGFSEAQMVNAVGISGSYTGELGILDHGAEEVTMARELRFPYATYQAILAALMAQKGFEGPSRIYEGHHGFAEVMARGKIDLARLTRRDEDFNILYTQTKWYPLNGRLQGQTEALLRLVTEHKIKPEAVAHVKITTTPRVLEHMGDPATHRYPQTKETADHSAYYTAALAIVDGAIHLNLDQFATERLRDPKLREVIDKIELVPIPEWADDAAPTTVEITMVENTTHECTVENPKGHVLNPVTDEELEEKFRGMASRFMDEAQMQTVFQTIYNLDKLDDIGELTRTLVFTR
jgi:2-methylcitrate dehydratase